MRKFLLLSLLVLLGCLGCTRKTETTQISMSIPTIKKLGALSTIQGQLDFAAINITYANGKKVVRTYEFHDDSSGTSGSTEFVETSAGERTAQFKGSDVVLGDGALVQFLGVYKNESLGQEEFTYADVTTKIVDGENLIKLDDQSFGVASKSVEFAGRYYTTSSGGPTGRVIIDFQPPGGKPSMEVSKSSIFDGWFNFFAPEFATAGVGLTYRLESTGEILFDSINTNSTLFTSISSEANRVVLSAPALQRLRGSGDVETDIATDYIFGYWEKSGAGSNIGAKTVCYPTESLGVRGTKLNSSGLPPVYYYSSGEVNIAAGGVPSSLDNIAYNGSCYSSDGLYRSIYPDRIGQGSEEVFGVQGPFSMVDPLAPYNGFIKMDLLDGGSVGHKINWKYLYGVLGSSVSGSTIFTKLSTNNGGDDSHYDRDEELSCDKFAVLNGYVQSGVSSSESYTLSAGSTAGSSFDILICPYKESADGVKSYYYSALQGRTEQVDQQHDEVSLGVTSGNVNSFASFGVDIGAYGRVTGLISDSDSNFIQFSIATASTQGFIAGDEVIAYIGSVGGTNSCGEFLGNPFKVGQHQKIRLLSQISASTYAVQSKGLIAQMVNDNLNTYLGMTSVVNNGHCGLYVAKVEHFKDLTIGNAGSINAEDFVFNAGGGIVAINVSGTFTLEGGVSANDSGYPASASIGDYGGGVKGQVGSIATGSGGQGGISSVYAAGGSGASYLGHGGGSSNGALGGSIGNDAQGHFVYGSAGGTDSFAPGGAGGGIVYIEAEEISLLATTSISADGQLASPGGGGGGGGSITLKARKIDTGAYTLALSSDGASGGSIQNGVGGGGQINLNYCDINTSTVFPVYTTSVLFGSSGSSINAGVGDVQENSENYFCN